MATQVQLRRGNAAEVSIAVGAEGELFYDTSLEQVVVQDGSTIGGHRVIQSNVDAVFDDGIGITLGTGNLGIGREVAGDWDSAASVIAMETRGAVFARNGHQYIGNNAKNTGAMWEYIETGAASFTQIHSDGSTIIVGAPSGTAGALITFAEISKITFDGIQTGPLGIPPSIANGLENGFVIASDGELITSRATVALAGHRRYINSNGTIVLVQTINNELRFKFEQTDGSFQIVNSLNTGIWRVDDEGILNGPVSQPPGIGNGTVEGAVIASTGRISVSRTGAGFLDHYLLYGGEGLIGRMASNGVAFVFRLGQATGSYQFRNSTDTTSLMDIQNDGNVTISAAIPIVANSLTRKDYVDTENAAQDLVISSNTTAIGVNSGLIGDNDTAIGVNAGSISTNAGNITTLQGTAPTADQKAALDNTTNPPNAGNPYATESQLGGFIPVVFLETRTANGAWSIAGLIVGKPLHIIAQFTGNEGKAFFHITAGQQFIDNPGTSFATYTLGWDTSNGAGGAPRDITIIPSATTVTLDMTFLGSVALHAFQ